MNKYLKKLVKLRVVKEKLTQQIDEIMPDAIAEAISLCEDKNRIVYQDENGKVILVLRKRFCTPEDDVTLSRLDADIKTATFKLAEKHAVELEEIQSKIQQLQDAIAELEANRDKLLCDRYVSRLKKQYKTHQELSAYSHPILSVFLNN